ncbi:1065_t:CDS:2 [Scutellospora calospora]|uniref:1065_t:CDS:1 n=1 Tax=Scutellospora calospora TaxID=85575 RepID=A0ACA9MHY8_9GLOM|nr:1065_t:CDS:2 [Scutellospora calospora]
MDQINHSKLRIDVISDRRQRAIVNLRKFTNLTSFQFFEALYDIVNSDPLLNIDERKYLMHDIRKIRDIQNVTENIGEKRLCEYCKNEVIATLYCEGCVRNNLKKQFNKWSSDNIKVDNLIRECQLNAVSPSHIIEYIPYDNFTDITFKARGGFSTIYTAIWENGPFTEWDIKQQELKRGGRDTYVLKTLENFEQCSKEINVMFGAEKYSQSLVKSYGLTRNFETREFMLVLQHMDSDLCNFIERNPKLDWKFRYKIVRNISNSIRKLHNLDFIHGDLHPGNVLIFEDKLHCVLNDFGLSESLTVMLGMEASLRKWYEKDDKLNSQKLRPTLVDFEKSTNSTISKNVKSEQIPKVNTKVDKDTNANNSINRKSKFSSINSNNYKCWKVFNTNKTNTIINSRAVPIGVLSTLEQGEGSIAYACSEQNKQNFALSECSPSTLELDKSDVTIAQTENKQKLMFHDQANLISTIYYISH